MSDSSGDSSGQSERTEPVQVNPDVLQFLEERGLGRFASQCLVNHSLRNEFAEIVRCAGHVAHLN